MMRFVTGEDYVSAFESTQADMYLFNSIAEPEENSLGGIGKALAQVPLWEFSAFFINDL